MTKIELKDMINKLVDDIGTSEGIHDDGPYKLKRQGNKIVKALQELYKLVKDDPTVNEFAKSNISEGIKALHHTVGKEVEYAMYSYKESKRKNAAKKRTAEYNSDYSEAISQMNSDVSFMKYIELE